MGVRIRGRTYDVRLCKERMLCGKLKMLCG